MKQVVIARKGNFFSLGTHQPELCPIVEELGNLILNKFLAAEGSSSATSGLAQHPDVQDLLNKPDFDSALDQLRSSALPMQLYLEIGGEVKPSISSDMELEGAKVTQLEPHTPRPPPGLHSVAPDNPPTAQAPRTERAALYAPIAMITPEKSMHMTMYYAAWRECLHYAVQQYPEEAQTMTLLHMKAKDLALKLSVTREGVQKFIQYIQGWLKQDLGEAR